MSKHKYTCTLDIEIDTEQYIEPVDGDLQRDIEELLDDFGWTHDGMVVTSTKVSKKGTPNG